MRKILGLTLFSAVLCFTVVELAAAENTTSDAGALKMETNPEEARLEAKLVQMRDLAKDRKWKELVEQFKSEDISAWPPAFAGKASEACNLRGKAYIAAGDNAQAEKDLNLVLKLSPDGYSWCALGDFYQRNLKDSQRALDAYNKAFEMDLASYGGNKSFSWMPISATLSTASILQNQGKHEEALKILSRYDQLDKISKGWRIQYLRAYGQIYAGMGREEECLAKFKEAFALESGEPYIEGDAGASTGLIEGATETALATPKKHIRSSTEDEGGLLAGTAKVDITPDDAFIIPNGGCAFRLPDEIKGNKPSSKDIHDPIFARVLVLKNGTTSLAIVSLDLVLFSSKKVITEAKAKWKVDHVILSSTHTHSSMVPRGLCPTPKGWEAWENVTEDPSLLLDWSAFSEDPWYAATEAKIVAAIGEAMTNLFPAQIAAGKGPFKSAYMAHNRRRVGADGKVTMQTIMWNNPKRLPTQPIDPTVGVIQVNDDSGKPRAFLVHYACHPVALMAAGVLSRDFPGAMVDYVEKELGDQCMAMFLQGALGDLDPYDMGGEEQVFNLVKQAGISLAKGALRVAKNMKPQQDKKNTSLEVRENLVKLQYRNGEKVTDACVMTAVINGEVALVTMPGEIFIQHQLNINNKSPITKTFLLGQAYCGVGSPWLRYIPTVQAVKEGGFGASTDWYSFIAADAGEKMVDEAVSSIKALVTKQK